MYKDVEKYTRNPVDLCKLALVMQIALCYLVIVRALLFVQIGFVV